MVSVTYTSVLVGSLAALAAARKCHNITVPITISSQNAVFSLKAPPTNIDVTSFVLNMFQSGSNYTASVLEGYKTVSGSYKIAATYCEPSSGPGKTVQVLTHGVGFDRSYWDFAYNNYNYSYVNEALARGYSTFAYDRLGLGQSSHGEPINEIQSYLEVSSLHHLTTLLRQAKIPNVPCKFDKVVHVGHSFGSIQTYGLAAQYPEDTDGIVLTGFTQNGNYVPYFGYGGNFVSANTNTAFRSYSAGYLAAGDASAVQNNFFSPGQFDRAILSAATAAGQPVTVGELLTLPAPALTLNAYEGPVLIITGDRDLPFCGGNCSATVPSIPAKTKQFFTNATVLEAVVVPDAGHGLNLEYSHTETYKTVLDFFDKYV